MPDADGDGNSDHEVYNSFSTARRAGERRATARSDANHLHGGVHSSTGNTIGTNRADRPDESNLCASIPTAAVMRSRRNDSARRALDWAKASRA